MELDRQIEDLWVAEAEDDNKVEQRSKRARARKLARRFKDKRLTQERNRAREDAYSEWP